MLSLDFLSSRVRIEIFFLSLRKNVASRKRDVPRRYFEILFWQRTRWDTRFAGTTFKLLNLRRAIESNQVYDVLLLPIELYSYVLGTLAELNVLSFIYLFYLSNFRGQQS